MNPKLPKVAYEWILYIGKEEVVLTENQHDFYKEHHEDSKVFFSDIEISPAFVALAIRLPARIIKQKYPCRVCLSSGRKKDNTDWCENCGGSGVDLPKK